MEKRVILLNARAAILKAVKDAGAYVLLFQSKGMLTPETIELADEIYTFDINNTEYAIGVARGLHEAKAIDAVLAYGELSVVLAGEITEALGVTGNPLQTVTYCRNKLKMREHLNSLDFSPVGYAFCRDKAELQAAIESMNFPVIVKPYNGAGSMGVYKLESAEQAATYLAGLKDEAFSPELLVEEFLEGNEVSVEAVSFEGKHTVIGITQKYTTGAPHFIETGHNQPAALPAETIAELTSFTEELLNKIGHQWGPSHTEVKLTPNGPRVIETHTRPGGDHITDMLEITSGVDMYKHTAEYAVTGEPPVWAGPTGDHAAVRFILLPPGTVKEIKGLDEVKANPNVVIFSFGKKVGDEVASATDSTNRHGAYVVKAASAEELERVLAEVQATFQVVVE